MRCFMSMSGGYHFYLEVNPKKPEFAGAMGELAELTQGFNRWDASAAETEQFRSKLEPFIAHGEPDVRNVAQILSHRAAALEQIDGSTFRFHTLVTQHEKDGVVHDDSAMLSKMTEPLRYPIGVQFGLKSVTSVPNCGMTQVTGSVTERGRTEFQKFPPGWQPPQIAA